MTFCYGLAVTSNTYIAYGALSLMVEINSVFLHARQLFILTHEPKTSSRYKANALLNIGTFVTCRILLLGWMTRHGYIFFLKIPRHFTSIITFKKKSKIVLKVLIMVAKLFCFMMTFLMQSTRKKRLVIKERSEKGS